MNIDHAAKRVEIGSTWYRKRVQRGPLNTECKLMLLRHAFEALDCIAVEFRTHFFNHASRRAIERLGAKMDDVAAQPSGHGGRNPTGHALLQHHSKRVARREDTSDVSDE